LFLNDQFLDLPIFNASKSICFKHYPNDDNDRDWITTHWLNMLTMKFMILEANVALCRARLLEFSKILKCECESKGLFKSWNIYGYNKVYMGIISLAYQLIIFYKLAAKGVCYSNKHNHL